MPRLKLILEYDGAPFVGWQVQPNGRSIQSEVEEALAQLLGVPTPTEVAGRTDAGVHAEGQVVAFNVGRTLPLRAYVQGLNGFLPPEIAVVRAEEVAVDYDPRRHSGGKVYRYRISNRPGRSPLLCRDHWEIFQLLEVGAMQEAARHLIGRHDFSAFRASNCQARHAVREVRSISIEAEGNRISTTIEGTAFLKHMVRNLVGTLVEVGRGRQPPEWVAEVLRSRDRTRAGPTAPAHGLTLIRSIERA